MKIKTIEYNDYYEIVITIPKDFKPKPSSIDNIFHEVASKYHIWYGALINKRKFKHLSTARQEVYYRLYNELGMSYSEIAKVMCRKNHDGIKYGIERHKTNDPSKCK
jgi:chromosomal replication initiation ATPase DnaA